MDLDHIQRIHDEADCLVSPADIDAAIDRMALEITARIGASAPLVFSVLNGGLIFSGRLLPKLAFPLELSYLHATRYGDRIQGDQLEWRAKPEQPVAGRTVLVLDDILDEGHTLTAILQHFKDAGATHVLSAVLVNKQHDRKATPGMRADFTGVDVIDRFLFGCGMDYKGYWRNAPGIYAVKGL